VAKAYCNHSASNGGVVAAGSSHGWEQAQEWIDSKSPFIVAAGWGTWSLVSIKEIRTRPGGVKTALQRVQKTIHQAPEPVRRPMNSFVIAVGLLREIPDRPAMEIGEKMGQSRRTGNTGVPDSLLPDYIRKVQKRGTIGKKRKTAKC